MLSILILFLFRNAVEFMTELSAAVVTMSYFMDAMPAARPNKSATEPAEVVLDVVTAVVAVADLDVVTEVVEVGDLDVVTAVVAVEDVVCVPDVAGVVLV